MEIFKKYTFVLRLCLLQVLSHAVALFAVVADLAPTVIIALDLCNAFSLICSTQIFRVGACVRTETYALLEPGRTVLGGRAACILSRCLFLCRFFLDLLLVFLGRLLFRILLRCRLIGVLGYVGYGCLIYIASLIGIDPSFYEAARLDGASKWQEITKITLPSLVPTIITLLLLSIGRIFYSDFGLFYQVPMNSGVLFPTTNVIDTYVYRALIEQGNISMSSAAGVYQSLVGFCVVMLSNWIVRKVDKDQALF